ncbi:MAG: hypothetical protein LJE69_14100 [Thiohalocapsa sp.]|uniref:hypothetical protein n=1 Tax=Thiohalocapsa sp. TaxID=2497641 RepID=UPI0025E904AB|nr:hypothetical protein [Thiohalocapsa sp.]MCG6942369.1 hypothetical protein [Thiohalocapsa sp.]
MPRSIDPSAAPGAAAIRARAGFPLARPQDIADREGLSHEQKIALLEQWEEDLREQMVAEEEAMPGGDASFGEALAEVLESLKGLGATEHTRPVPSKHG